MNQNEMRNWTETVLVVSDAYPEMRAEHFVALYRLSRSLQRLNEQACNGTIQTEEEDRQRVRIAKKLAKIGREVGMGPEAMGVQRDPRGRPIMLNLPTGRSNCLDGTWRI